MNYGHHYIDKDDIKAVEKVLKSDFLTQGNTVTEFEERLADYVGAKYCVVVNSGTSALHLAVKVLNNIGKIKNGYTSANTFVASANCMFYEKIKVHFQDINLKSYNMIAPKKHDLVIAVHFAGLPLDYHMNGLVIEDGCHALGAKGVGNCAHSQMTCFSFHPVKTITTGEGGAITTNNETLYEELKELRSHGQDSVGYNYRMSDVLAALGISQLSKIERFLERRREIFQMYNTALGGWIKLPVYSDDSACHLYVAWFDKRDQVREYLKQQGINTQIHYIPAYRQRPYGFYNGDCKNAEKYYEHALSLPLYYGMTDNDVGTVINGVRNAIAETKSIL
jgi:dTDP-4-amino-4,6-dideoxygalactose transaminase